MNRNSIDYDLGVGKISYIKGDGKFKEYVKFKCVYAVELNEGLAVIKQSVNYKFYMKIATWNINSIRLRIDIVVSFIKKII